MNVLLTGGAGFIGSHLADRLLEEGHHVAVVDNLVLGKEENIRHIIGKSSFAFYKLDILDFDKFDAVVAKEKPDIVFHMAANSDIQKGGADPNVDFGLTLTTTFNVLKSMRTHGVKKLVFASTSAIYGETRELLHENFAPLRPVSMYGASKMASEAYIYAFSANCDIQVWITRFPNVVGERFTHGVIYDFVKKLRANPAELTVLGNGQQYKPYVYVKDLVDGIMFCWKNSSEKINVYNLGVDSRTRVRDIAAMVIEEMGLHAEIKYTGGDRGWVGDVPEFSYDLSKVQKLGWKASRTSDEAVRIAIKRALGKAE
jgi:UDP-glucose 4-epimerase